MSQIKEWDESDFFFFLFSSLSPPPGVSGTPHPNWCEQRDQWKEEEKEGANDLWSVRSLGTREALIPDYCLLFFFLKKRGGIKKVFANSAQSPSTASQLPTLPEFSLPPRNRCSLVSKVFQQRKVSSLCICVCIQSKAQPSPPSFPLSPQKKLISHWQRNAYCCANGQKVWIKAKKRRRKRKEEEEEREKMAGKTRANNKWNRLAKHKMRFGTPFK